jgi:hypothetical protein
MQIIALNNLFDSGLRTINKNKGSACHGEAFCFITSPPGTIFQTRNPIGQIINRIEHYLKARMKPRQIRAIRSLAYAGAAPV